MAPVPMMRLSKLMVREEPSLRATSTEVALVIVPQPSTSSILFFFIR